MITKDELINWIEIRTKNLFAKRLSKEFPFYTISGKYQFDDTWSNGFFPGILWLLYRLTENEQWLELAMKTSFELVKYCTVKNNQDIGYILLPSVIKGYEITKNKDLYNLGLMGANSLLNCVTDKGFLKCDWKENGNRVAGIDSLMNIGLFAWAYQQTKNQVFYQSFLNCIKEAENTLIKSDGSSVEYVSYNSSAIVIGTDNHNAYRQNSVWSRGQAWSIYGLTRIYSTSKSNDILSKTKRQINFWIARIKQNAMPYWDLFEANLNPKLYDSSAAAIVLSALLTLDQFKVLDSKQKNYLNKLLTALLSKEFINLEDSLHEGILLHASTPLKIVDKKNESQIWGDYFLLECIAKMNGIKDLF